MPKEQEDFKYSVDKIIEAVMFENWLRFYFITPMQDEKDSVNDDPHLFMIIPEKAMEKIKELYPDLLPLATKLNHEELTFEVSQKAVCTYVVENIDGKIMPRDTAPSIMNSMSFQVELQLFNTWIQLHASQFEEGFADFGTWQTLFKEWKDSPKGHDLMEKLILAQQNVAK